MSRREFTRNQREQIVERSKRNGNICCERCGLVLGAKPYEVDHIIPEALRPEADKQSKITIAEGQLLGKECCHRGKDGKTNADVKAISHAKRVYDRAHGLKKASSRPIQSAPFQKSEKAAKRVSKPALPNRPLYKPVESGDSQR